MRGFAGFIVKNRLGVLALSLVVTLILGLQLRHLNVVVDADELLPKNHPFVLVTERVEALFGNRFTVVIGITARDGDVYTPEILDKVIRVTEALAATPGVTQANLQSLAARQAKDIVGTPEGLQVSRLLERKPADLASARAVATRLAANPIYRDILVSRDGRTAAIYAEFKKDPAGFGAVMAKVNAAVAPVRDPTVDIAIAGQPAFLAAIETYSKRMALLLPLAIVLIGLIHLEAFRTVQGLVLPLVTAILAMVWALGIMTLAGQHLDPFNNITPILILAVAAGHAVQVLKRYYEEYRRLRQAGVIDPREANRQAVVSSIQQVGPVMLAAGSIAALSFMSLAIFPIQSIRGFGIFAGIGIFSIVVVELTFTPALRAMLPPPGDRETNAEKAQTLWDRLAKFLGGQVAEARGRRRIAAIWVVVVAALAVGAGLVRVDNSLRGFIGAGQVVRKDDHALNAALAGSNTFYVLVEGAKDDAIKDPAVLRGIEATQAFLAREANIGRSVSIVDHLKQINQALNGGDPMAYRLPTDRDTISQFLLLYSISGEPGDFDGVVDYPYRNAIIQAFVKTDSSAYVASLNERILPVIRANFPPGVTVRLGGSVTTPTAMNEVMVSGKLKNIAQISLVVFVIATLLFRSPLLGALIVVPLGATALAVFGIMGLAGIPLQIATATVCALAIGIGADYAIYLTYRLREELRNQADEREAILAAFASSGKAVMFVATAVAGGYAVLMLSPGFNVHFWLGLLVGLAMVVAAASTLTLFAALLVALRPRAVFPARAPAATSPPRALRRGVAAVLALALGAGALALPHPVHAAAPAAKKARARPAKPPKAAKPAPPPAPIPVDPVAVMTDSSRATKVFKSTSAARFTLTNKAGQARVRDTTGLSALKPDGQNNRRLIRFNTPADIAGTSVLTVENAGAEDDIWIYLPALKKVRRLTAANKKDAFVGTDFSYGDILGQPVEEWTHKFLRNETVAGAPVRVIESLPRDPSVAANSGYGRRVSWIRVSDAAPVKAEYYDLQGALLKVYAASDIRLVDPAHKRVQAMRQQMTNVQTGHTTLIEYTGFDTDMAIADARFLPRTLDQR